MSATRSFLRKFLTWRIKHIKQKNFVLILSVVVGFASGLIAVIIKNAALWIENTLAKGVVHEYLDFLYVLGPLVGIILTLIFVQKVVKQRVYGGIPNTLYAISRQSGNIRRHNLYSSIIGSALTVGFGGSAGLEGPAVTTSAAMSSKLGQAFRMNRNTKVLLIGCAAAGSLAAIFNAPVAAIVFAIEVIMLDLTTASLVPLLLASIAAALTSRLYLGEDVLFRINIVGDAGLKGVMFFVLLGIFTGLVSVGFRTLFFSVSRFFEKMYSPMVRAVAGGLMLGGIIFLFPALYGEGYEFINAMAKDAPFTVINNGVAGLLGDGAYVGFILLFALIVFKVIATAITIGSGGIGGIFAPSLFIGSACGFFFAKVTNYVSETNLPIANFTLVGMAGLMAGVLHAPLTSIFLIAEITGGYQLFIPLMITVAVSYTTVRLFSKYSIYTEDLAKRGDLLTHDKDQAVLTLMKLEDVIDKDLLKVHPEETLGELVKNVSASTRNHFPVVDEKNFLVGVVSLDNIRTIMFNHELYETRHVEDYMTLPDEIIDLNDSMELVLEKFEKSGAWNLPVVYQNHYVGFVSRSKLFSKYREQLVSLTDMD